MKQLTSIVAVSREGAIGCRNELPWKLKTDMKFFRETTVDNTVIMGRKTRDSIGGCLPNRMNVVLSHNAVLFESTPNCKISLSIEEALYAAEKNGSKEVFVVGGASTYEQFAPLVNRYLITIVDKFVGDADAFFSESIFGLRSNWIEKIIAEHGASAGVDEANFKIIEMTAKDSKARFQKREAILSSFKERLRLKQTIRNKKKNEGISAQSLVLQF